VPSGVADPSRAAARRRTWISLAIVLVVVALDQLTKTWAVHRLDEGPIAVFGSDVGFQLSRNTGSAFSLFQGFTPLLAILAVVIAVVLVRAVRRTEDMLTVVALSLVLGGATGNLLDRIVRSPGFLHGAVVDFVHVGDFPTFNVADSAITIGAVLLVVRALFPGSPEPA
jgi:signal peptidase II